MLSMARTGVKLDLSVTDSQKLSAQHGKDRVKLDLSVSDSQTFSAQHGKDRGQARSSHLR